MYRLRYAIRISALDMTDAELIEAQHRVILNMPCWCNMPWKHSTEQPKCSRCVVLQQDVEHHRIALEDA
jgi:hypothetical protein